MPTQEPADLLIEAAWLLPIAPLNTALGAHALAVRDGRIVALGPAAELRARFAPRDHLIRASHVLMPGFVNAHTHAAAILLRGLPVHPPLMRWLRETVSPAEERWIGPDFVREGTQLAVAEMLRAGVTAFSDLYLFPEQTARVASEARVRVVIGLPLTETPTAWAESATAHFAKSEQLWDEYKSSPWVSMQFAPPAPYLIGDATLSRVRRLADELDARIAMPVHETEVEVHDGLARHGRRPLRRLDELGLLRPGFTAIHMNRLDEEDLARTQRTGIAVIACPQANLRLGSGSCAVAELLSRDVTVGLGTDSPLAAGALDVLAEARAAALLASVSSSAATLASWDALRLATLGGAMALGLGTLTGSLEVGKAADLVCLDLGMQAHLPQSALADAVLFGATRQQISDVWINGHAAVQGARLLSFDEQELARLSRHWCDRVHVGAAA